MGFANSIFPAVCQRDRVAPGLVPGTREGLGYFSDRRLGHELRRDLLIQGRYRMIRETQDKNPGAGEYHHVV